MHNYVKMTINKLNYILTSTSSSCYTEHTDNKKQENNTAKLTAALSLFAMRTVGFCQKSIF